MFAKPLTISPLHLPFLLAILLAATGCCAHHNDFTPIEPKSTTA